MRRASPYSSASVCSAAAIVLPVGALTTVMPARVAASRSTLSTPTPARPMTTRRVPGGDERGVDLDLAAHDERVVVGQDRAQLVAREARPLVDLVLGPEELDALGGDGFGDEDPHAPAPACRSGQPEGLDGGGLGRGDRGARSDVATARRATRARAC